MKTNHCITLLSGVLMAITLTACSSDSEFSTWPCRFSYNNQIHNDATLASAMNSNSRGVFCKISQSTAAGVFYFNFESSDGVTKSSQPMTAEEKQEWQRGGIILGINNGIIVGYQTLITDGPFGGFIAYDVQCPNCVRRENNTVNPNYRVSTDSQGIATCPKCGKRYDMNNGGIITNGVENDTGLEKYIAVTMGPLSVLSVMRRN